MSCFREETGDIVVNLCTIQSVSAACLCLRTLAPCCWPEWQRLLQAEWTQMLSLTNSVQAIIIYLACVDLSSQRTHHRNAIATPLWRTGPLGVIRYYQPMSLVAFIVRPANPEVTLPRWVIYLFLHGRLYRQSLYALGGKMLSDYSWGRKQTSIRAIYSGRAAGAVSGQSSCNDSIILQWIPHPCFLFTAVLVSLFVCLPSSAFFHLSNVITLKSTYAVSNFITVVCVGLCLVCIAWQ